ncbi:LysR substrate-binding domain-containing protein [Dactylosporangium sp. CA-233914]|uniref:LysR family transcriptional regulator n=1 Tax=Dactylosporangium sp. CA-233914 TaxID=3239934 RepID=UPI003D927B4D
MPINPWRLRLLCELETLGTVRAVAEAVHQSASSVSQQLSLLESEAGTHLIERTGRSVRLTPNGHLLARRGRAILDAMTEAMAELHAVDNEPTGMVQVASFQSAIHSLVVPTVAALRKEHPAVEVRIEELEPNESSNALLRGHVDAIITTEDVFEAPMRSEFDVVPLLTDSIVLVLPPGHPATRHETVDLATLADESWTFEPEGLYMSSLATQLCRAAGFEPRIICRFNSYLIALQHIEAGGSIALLPELAVDRRYNVVTRELRPAYRRQVVGAVRSTSATRAAVRVVVDRLREAAAGLPGSADEELHP